MKRRIAPKPDSVIEWETHQPQKCMKCGKWRKDCWQGLAVHHIQRRTGSFKPFRDNHENLLLLCWDCHNIVEHWPKARQLALKWQRDKAGHTTLSEFVTAWLHIGDKGSGSAELVAPYRVTAEEVEAYLERAA